MSGIAQAGSTLTALTSSIQDANGLEDAEFTYQWVRVDGGDETDIRGETERTYELEADDVGMQVKVRVSYTDDAGFAHTVTSAAFPRTGTVVAAPVMTEPGAVLSATLTVKSLTNNWLGCEFGTGSSGCGNTSVLTDDDFTFLSTTRTITDFVLRNEILKIFFDGPFTDAEKEQLELTVTGRTDALEFSDDEDEFTNDVTWGSTGLTWSAGDSVSITIRDTRGTGDVTPPAHSDSTPWSVSASGTQVNMYFTESLDSGNPPAAKDFTVTADGSPISLSGLDIADSAAVLNVFTVIRQGQAVTLSYTDPTSGDDTNALQDAAGNDVPSFQIELRNNSTVTGTPGKPTGLTATAVGGTQIELAWTAPGDAGRAPITGYRIEWSADGNARWTELEANTGTTRGRTCAGRTPASGVAYCDSGLASETTRHYRVAAINSIGAGSNSDTANATTDDIVAPVPVSASSRDNSISIQFDEALDGTQANFATAGCIRGDGRWSADQRRNRSGGRPIYPKL